MGQRKKTDCTPEEWAVIRAKDVAYQQRYRAQEEKRAKVKAREAKRHQTPEYRAASNAAYNERRREQHLAAMRARVYGATAKQVADLMRLQDGKCGICRRSFDALRKPGAKHGPHCFDHNHQTGAHRGLLCRMCNTLEGFIKKLNLTPIEYAEQMRAYLDNPPAEEEILW